MSSNNGNVINRVSVRRQRQIYAQILGNAQPAMSATSNQNIARNAQMTQNVQTSGWLKYDQKNSQNRGPMMY